MTRIVCNVCNAIVAVKESVGFNLGMSAHDRSACHGSPDGATPCPHDGNCYREEQEQ